MPSLLAWVRGATGHPDLYVVEELAPAGKEFATYHEILPLDLLKQFTWISGKPIPIDLPNPIRYEQDKDLPLEDLLLTTSSQFLASTRLFAIVRAFSSCARGYPARIERGGVVTSDDYLATNFESSWACLDQRRSKVEQWPDGTVKRVCRLVVDPAKMPESEGLFRLSEHPRRLLATPAFRHSVEAASLTGIGFIDPRQARLA